MKHRLILLISAAALALVGCVKQDDIDNLNSQLDAIEAGQIASIESQISAINASIEDLKKTDSALKTYLDGLEQELETLASSMVGQTDDIVDLEDQIEALKEADDSLQEKIDELQDYVDKQLADQESWANATFATIDQFKIVSSAIATVDKRLKTCEGILDGFELRVTEGYKDALQKAIAASEASMKQWVNEKLLADYYTIEQFDARIAEIKKNATAADDAIKKDLDKQTEALAKAREDLTKAYTEAITEAINDLKGKISDKLAADIKTASDALQAKIDEVNEALDDIKTRLAKLEADLDALVGQIQSIAVIPDNAYGSVNIGNSTSESIKFDVRPQAAVKALVDAGDVSVFSFKVKGVETKGGGGVATMNVTAAEVNDAGELVLTVDASGLGSGFAAGTQALSASLVVKSKDGVTAKSSDYFALKSNLVLPGEFSVSATKKVKFTKSDIYWDGSAFKFEENQTDYPTSWNSSHVGHFFWTKTAEASYAAIYDDGTCTASDKFFADGSDDAHMLTVDGLGGLYVMTRDEMYYLFRYRTNASKLYKPDVSVTTGAGTFSRCVVIAPDNWDYTKNPLKTSYTAAEFAIAESAGLVCLPSAGGRVGSNVAEAGLYGVFWMATLKDESSAEDLWFISDIYPNSYESREYGSSIRLVCTVSN